MKMEPEIKSFENTYTGKKHCNEFLKFDMIIKLSLSEDFS